MDRFNSMQVFVRAVERGSFAAAASDIGISATMVGMHVRALEERLGGRLLSRTTRRQSLTEIGRLYYERCRQILSDVDDAELVADQLRAAPRGTLHVSAPVSFGVQALTPVVAEYLAQYREVKVELSLSDRVVDLVEDGFDVAVRVGELADSSLIARPLAPYRLVLCASPAYLKRHGQPRSPRELAAHNCLAFERWGARPEWRFNNGDVVQCKGNLRINSGQALRVAAYAGIGIIQQPLVLLAEDLRAGRLVHILSDYATRARPMHLVYLPDRRLTPKLKSFLDLVSARFARTSNKKPR